MNITINGEKKELREALEMLYADYAKQIVNDTLEEHFFNFTEEDVDKICKALFNRVHRDDEDFFNYEDEKICSLAREFKLQKRTE